MTASMEYVTFESREASFAPPSKRSKTGGWPHSVPRPEELAKAGFYFKPSAQSSDNTVCFLCSRNLDGWEEEDDPIQEHLKHAEDCGWAVLSGIEQQAEFDPSDMEDPTGERLSEARRATFATGWPHESKRGWTCKVEKMVEAGWHFAPTADSDDYVSCAYCKLCLDGWEPKDNPFDEHYSRSSSCPFFVFAGTTAPSKRPKAKKGRASRSSRTSKVSARLSIQSNATVHEEEQPSIQDVDDTLNTSAVSLMSTASTATAKGGKRKAAAGKAKGTKSKKAKTTRSKKKVGAETETEPEIENIPEPEPETKSLPKTEVNERITPEEQVIYPSIEAPPGPGSQTEQTGLGDRQQDGPRPHALSPASSLGPPEREASAIPIAADSPVPARVSTSNQRSSARHSHGAISVSRPTPRSKQSAPGSQVSSSKHTTSRAKETTPQAQLPSSPASTSDLENAPPSTLPKSSRPPLPVISPGHKVPKWSPIDVEMVFESTPVTLLFPSKEADLSTPEKQMTVTDWIKHVAGQAEEDLRMEGERLVGIFEMEGAKAMGVLEGLVCV